MNKNVLAVAMLALCGAVTAKIPAPVLDDAAKAKAAEAAAKTAWQAKVDAWQLCKAQDRVAAMYKKAGGKAVAASAPAAKVAAAPASAASGAAQTTPVAYSSPGACADPGPYAYNPPSQTPLETSGAHSPAGTAKAPPSVNQESAKMAPAPKK